MDKMSSNGFDRMKSPKLTPFSEGLAPLSKLLRQIPGVKASPQNNWRWVHRGVSGGIKLPAILIADRWYSTPEAVSWFFQARTKHRLESSVFNRDETVCDVTDDELASVGL